MLLLNNAVHNRRVTPCIHLALSYSPKQEVQNIFKAKHPMDAEITKAKVGGSVLFLICSVRVVV